MAEIAQDRELAVLAEQDRIWKIFTQEDGRWQRSLQIVAQRIASAQQLVRDCHKEEMRRSGEIQSAREIEERSTSVVSQRDIQRCIRLFQYFLSMIWSGTIETPEPGTARGHQRRLEAEVDIASDAAIACVYYLRLDGDDRKAFSRRMTRGQESFSGNLRWVIAKYVDHIKVPSGISKNEALEEQLFLTLVCTITKTPLFLVGPPGSGKTLSFNLVVQNLNGSDSPSLFFRGKDFPLLQALRYQCSRKSTSTQVKAVFERARKRQARMDARSYFCNQVVFLDEAGLPEAKRESLKVLHYYLDHPSTSFVASSNSRPDAAKANRAILCERAGLTKEELQSIGRAAGTHLNGSLGVTQALLDALCDVYLRLMEEGWFRGFFGHRDFVFFLRHLTRWIRQNGITMGNQAFIERPKPLLHAVQRNFSGFLGPEPNSTAMLIQEAFLRDSHLSLGTDVETFIQENRLSPVELLRDAVLDRPRPDATQSLRDVLPRPKLIVDTSLDASIMELISKFNLLKRGTTNIFQIGNFPEMAELEHARIVAGVKHAATQGHAVVLINTEAINESFYDMFNQHFHESRNTEGKKLYFASIAVGDHTESTQVHQDFMCVVLVRKEDLGLQPAPFLNRFEKFLLCHDDFLTELLDKLPKGVKRFVVRILEDLERFLEGHEHFTRGIYGYVEKETMRSLMLSILPCDLGQRLHQKESETPLEAERLPAEPAFAASTLNVEIANAILDEMHGFAVGELGFRGFPCTRGADDDSSFDVVTRLNKEANLTRSQTSSLCRRPSACTVWLKEALACLKSGRRSRVYEKSRLSFALSLFCYWIKSNCLMRLLNLSAPESILVSLRQLPLGMCRHQLLGRERTGFRMLLEKAFEEQTRLLMTYTRSGRFLSQLPSHFDPSSNQVSEQQKTLISLMVWKEVQEVRIYKMSAFRTQRDFSAAVDAFLANDTEKLFIMMVDVSSFGDSWTGVQEESPKLSSHRAIVNRRISFIRIALEESLCSPRVAGGKVACVVLRVLPDCLHARQPMFSSLYSPTWEHVFLDEIAPIGTAATAFLLFSLDHAIGDPSQSTTAALTGDANAVIEQYLQSKLGRIVRYFVHRASSHHRLAGGEYNRRIEKLDKIVAATLRAQGGAVSTKVGKLIIDRFLALWDVQAAEAHVFRTAREHVSGVTRNTTFNRSIERPFEYDFEYFVSWFLEQLCLNKAAAFLASAPQPRKSDLFDILSVLPVPPLQELRIQGTCHRVWTGMWAAADASWSVHPCFHLVHQEVESVLSRCSMVLRGDRENSIASTAHAILRHPMDVMQTVKAVLEEDTSGRTSFLECLMERHGASPELFRCYLAELLVGRGVVHDMNDDATVRAARLLVRTLQARILGKNAPPMRLFQAHAELQIGRDDLLQLLDILVCLFRAADGAQQLEKSISEALLAGDTNAPSLWSSCVRFTFENASAFIAGHGGSEVWLPLCAILFRVKQQLPEEEEQQLRGLVFLGILKSCGPLHASRASLALAFKVDHDWSALKSVCQLVVDGEKRSSFLDQVLDWGLTRAEKQFDQDPRGALDVSGPNYDWLASYLDCVLLALESEESPPMPKARKRYLAEIALRCEGLWKEHADPTRRASPLARLLYERSSPPFFYTPPKYCLHLQGRSAEQLGISSILADVYFLSVDAANEMDPRSITDGEILKEKASEACRCKVLMENEGVVESAILSVDFALALEDLLRSLARCVAHKLVSTDAFEDHSQALHASRLDVLSDDGFVSDLRSLLDTSDERMGTLRARSFMAHLQKRMDGVSSSFSLAQRLHRCAEPLRQQFENFPSLWSCLRSVLEWEDQRDQTSLSLQKLEPMTNEVAKPSFMTYNRDSDLGRVYRAIKDDVRSVDETAVRRIVRHFEEHMRSGDERQVGDLRYLLFMTIYWEHSDSVQRHDTEPLCAALRPGGLLFTALRLSEVESRVFLAFISPAFQQSNLERWVYITTRTHGDFQALVDGLDQAIQPIRDYERSSEAQSGDGAKALFNFEDRTLHRHVLEMRHAIAAVVGSILGSSDRHPLRVHLLEPGKIHMKFPLGSLYDKRVCVYHYDCGTEVVRNGTKCRSDYRPLLSLSPDSFNLCLFLSYAPILASLLCVDGAYDQLRGFVFSGWLPLNAHLRAKLEEVWGFLCDFNGRSQRHRLLLVITVADHLRRASFEGEPFLPTFANPAERVRFENMFASIHQRVCGGLPSLEEACRQLVQLNEEHKELSLFSSSVAGLNTVLQLQLMDEEELIARCLGLAGEEADDVHLSFLRNFFGDRNKLVALTALPTLYRAYQWTHDTLTGMVSEDDALDLTLGELTRRISRSTRWSPGQTQQVQELWDQVYSDMKAVKEAFRKVGAGPCGEVAVEENDDQSSSATNIPDIAENTSVMLFISASEEENLVLRVLTMLGKQYNALASKYLGLYERMKEHPASQRRQLLSTGLPVEVPIALERLTREGVICSGYDDARDEGASKMTALLRSRFGGGWFSEGNRTGAAYFDVVGLAWDVFDTFMARKNFRVEEFERIGRAFRFSDSKQSPGYQRMEARVVVTAQGLWRELCEVSSVKHLPVLPIDDRARSEMSRIWRGLSLDKAIKLLRCLLTLQQRRWLPKGDLQALLAEMQDAEGAAVAEEIQSLYQMRPVGEPHLGNDEPILEQELLNRMDADLLPTVGEGILQDIQSGWFDFVELPSTVKRCLPAEQRHQIQRLWKDYEEEDLRTAMEDGVAHDGDATRAKYRAALRDLEGDLKSMERYACEANGEIIGLVLQDFLDYKLSELPARIFREVQVSCYVDVMCEVQKMVREQSFAYDGSQAAFDEMKSYDIFANDRSLWADVSRDIAEDDDNEPMASRSENNDAKIDPSVPEEVLWVDRPEDDESIGYPPDERSIDGEGEEEDVEDVVEPLDRSRRSHGLADWMIEVSEMVQYVGDDQGGVEESKGEAATKVSSRRRKEDGVEGHIQEVANFLSGKRGTLTDDPSFNESPMEDTEARRVAQDLHAARPGTTLQELFRVWREEPDFRERVLHPVAKKMLDLGSMWAVYEWYINGRNGKEGQGKKILQYCLKQELLSPEDIIDDYKGAVDDEGRPFPDCTPEALRRALIRRCEKAVEDAARNA
uniref:AAA+ ATPase domain-containing protein n=1 Tax=Pinguiococcus pyrenoidosus TaxID=172671 RepID=A0A7R9Y9S0_9STRA